jgi:hypothetical protein
VAVLTLVQAGKLGLQDPVGEHLPGYPDAAVAQRVTVHQLLTHTAGMGDVFGPDFNAHLFERFPDLHHLDVDQLDFRLVAVRPSTEQHGMKRRPGRDRTPKHEANHFTLLRRGIENRQQPRDIVIADAKERLQLFQPVTQRIGFDFRHVVPSSPMPTGNGAATSSILVISCLIGPPIAADVLLLVAILPRRHPSCKPFPSVDPKPGAPRIPHPSGHRRFGIRHRVAAAIIRNLNDFFR